MEFPFVAEPVHVNSTNEGTLPLQKTCQRFAGGLCLLLLAGYQIQVVLSNGAATDD